MCAELLDRINVELALKRCALVSLSIRLGRFVQVMNRDACLALRGGAVYVGDRARRCARWRDYGGCAAPVAWLGERVSGILEWSRY